MKDKEKFLPASGRSGPGPDLQLAFDVGHSSIGWAVLQAAAPGSTQTPGPSINILGCGVVTFRADDCLASARRGYRRQRRHIRSTRQRIARMKILLAHLGVLTPKQLDLPGCAWPWLLAARVLRGGKLLAWPELWDVLRWYAHNRGYDGNRRWSAVEAEAEKEDTEKEENARTLMGKYGVKTMAETFCAVSGLDPLGSKKSCHLPGDKRPKGQNAAFPRATVESEVRCILKAHFGRLAKVDESLERVLLGRDNQDATAWQAIPCPELKLPKRYQGALLFGQLVPRFDNRIISKCPISGEKVPSRNCPEFLNFRWAMQLANIRVARFGEKDLSPLTVPERKQLDSLMRQQGGMGVEEFKKQVRQITSAIRDNLETMFMHPDAKEALLLDPIQKLTQSADLKSFWNLLPERLQKRTRGQWRRGKSITLGRLREQLGPDTAAFETEVTRQIDSANVKGRNKGKQISREDLLNKLFSVRKLDQRAAFARHILKQAFDEVMAGKHPKEEGGCLFVTEQMRQAQLQRTIAQQTNNHLVRHRLLILERLLADIIKEYAAGDKTRIARLTIEVNRDLREMSGMTAKQKAQDLGLRIANHHHVAEALEKDESLMKLLQQQGTHISAGLIRKARVADDLGWMCPYTSQRFEPVDLVTKRVDKDHIVPRSDRASDSLDSLVITFSAINKWKGKRTAWQFVEQEQGKPVPDLPNLSILSLTRYKQLVEGLETFKGHDDDKRRKKKRKDLLLLPNYEEKEFTPRDLTTTSQLVRLGALSLRKAFIGCENQPVIVSLPGSVTGTVRKAWKLLGCLSLACPQVLGENGEVKKKDDIRDITHLHHALDACVLGLASHFIPNNGRVWELIVKRNPNDSEKRELMALGVFGFGLEGRFEMRDLDNRLKEQIRQRLAEKRVVQHIPASMDGLRVEQNTWRVVGVKEGEATLRQRIRAADGSRPQKPDAFEKTTKLIGLSPINGHGKLSANKGALIIPDNFGIALTEPEAVIIPFHKVWPRLTDLKKVNGGKVPVVLRNGQIIRVSNGKNFKGVWRVFSSKNNATGIALDIGFPDVVRLKNKTDGHKINVRLATLIKDGMEVLKTPLTGIASCPTTSSA
jgi:CRISPR-associated endonuclease Csn1